MLQLRRAGERGHADHGWLKTYHTFSFADYFDPKQMGFRALRVVNEDTVAPGEGFGAHPHRDMEIVTYVLEGALEHRDSLGNGSLLRAGELQRMTAGTGIVHSEFNPSAGESVHLYQIWLLPARKGLAPSYEQKRFGAEGRQGQLRLVVSPDGQDGSLIIQQDVRLYLAALEAGQSVRHPLKVGRHGWVQVTRGAVEVNGLALKAGDGLAASDEAALEVKAEAPAEVMVFDLT